MLLLITTNVASGTGASPVTAAIVLLCAIAIGLLLWQRARLSGTTLTGVWWWSVGSFSAIAAGEILLAMLPYDLRMWCASPLRFITATSTFCPGVYVLGARRPHAGAWHFVVLSLWGIIALPALESLLLNRGGSLELGPIRGWFLWIAIVVVSLNYLPTRHWISALLYAGGQLVLLSPYLSLLTSEAETTGAIPARELAGVALLSAALVIAALRRPRSSVNMHPLDAAWLSFRDAFGGLWALRVLERMKVAGHTYGWPLALGWSGFYFHDAARLWSDIDQNTVVEVQKTLDNMRRRFVDLQQLGE